MWKHNTHDIIFTLIIDDFGVKYMKKADAEHLMTTLHELYSVSKDWEDAPYCGLTIAWDYIKNPVDISIPSYIEHALQCFEHPQPSHPQHAPHAWQKPQYSATMQYALHLTIPLP
jgi:hypothetical protein